MIWRYIRIYLFSITIIRTLHFYQGLYIYAQPYN